MLLLRRNEKEEDDADRLSTALSSMLIGPGQQQKLTTSEEIEQQHLQHQLKQMKKPVRMSAKWARTESNEGGDYQQFDGIELNDDSQQVPGF